MLRTIGFVGVCLLLFHISLSASAQTAVAPSPQKVRDAIERLRAEQRPAVRNAIRTTQPYVIFLPGVLGSRLQDGSVNIFGDGVPSEKVEYVEGKAIKAELLDELRLAPVRTSYTNAYGKPVSFMQGVTLAASASFAMFPYDWRQSNIRSADEFSNFICGLEDIRSRPVMFIAHSMGGIVLKYWLAARYRSATCGGERIDQIIQPASIRHVIFVGTPHLGAPKALGALIDNYFLIGERDGSYFKLGVNQVIARSLNDYGGTFPSAYELLPRLSLDCDAKWTTPPVVMKTGGVDSPIRNIFHVDLWKNYNWPKGPYPKAPAARKKFLEANLAKFLNNANELTCTLARYDIDKEFTVTRFYGSDLDTDCSVIVGATGWRGEHTLEFTSCPGDGTVPVESANERRNDGRRLPGGHLDMLSSDAFISALSELYNKNMQALDLAYAKATGTDRGPVELRAELDLIIPPNPNPASEAEKAASDTTRRTNDEVVKRRDEQKGLPPGTTASRIYKDARDKQKSKDPLVRANGYRVAAELEGTNPQRRAWALNNSADISFEQEDYSKAKALALKALQEADAVQRKHAGLRADMRRLTGLAAWTVAVSSKKLGQSNDVDRYTRLAIQNGNPKARRIQI